MKLPLRLALGRHCRYYSGLQLLGFGSHWTSRFNRVLISLESVRKIGGLADASSWRSQSARHQAASNSCSAGQRQSCRRHWGYLLARLVAPPLRCTHGDRGRKIRAGSPADEARAKEQKRNREWNSARKRVKVELTISTSNQSGEEAR
jgi:hypothetical protein